MGFGGTVVPFAKGITAWAKVRLAHAEAGSFLLVDHLFLKDAGRWLQPKNFVLSQVLAGHDSIDGRIVLDLPDGTTIEVQFSDEPVPSQLADGSWLYEALVFGPDDLISKGAGIWRMGPAGVPQLRLHHHTTAANKQSIQNTQELWSSQWNFQGTRKLKNIGYVYFTDLPFVQTEQDLRAMAMSSTKAIHLQTDGSPSIDALPPNWRSTGLTNYVLQLDVYWSAPEQRDSTVTLYVDADLLCPTHMLRHNGTTVWYEMILPHVCRVGLKPGQVLKLDRDEVSRPAQFQNIGYHVIGDATTLDGLAAPYDEENTNQVFKVEIGNMSPLRKWVTEPNQDHFSGVALELQEFQLSSDEAA